MEDFEELLYSFAKKMRVRFSYGAIARLKKHPWPGNIRELISITERFVTLADRSRLDDFPYLQQLLVECLDNPKSSVACGQIGVIIGEDYVKDVKAAEREVLRYYLAKHGGNMVELAKSLGIGRTTLYSKLKDLSLK